MRKKLDGNGVEESRDLDTRRWQEQNNNGHQKGSRLDNANERSTEELREAEDKSDYNKLDSREEMHGNI